VTKKKFPTLHKDNNKAQPEIGAV